MLASRPVWIGRWVSVSCSWWEALWDGEMEARGAVSSMQNAGRELQPEQEPFSLISRGAWLCLSPSLTLTDATQPTCWTLHFPVQLFCSVVFFPFDSKSSRGGEFENFSGARCVCVCGALFARGGSASFHCGRRSLPPFLCSPTPSHASSGPQLSSELL